MSKLNCAGDIASSRMSIGPIGIMIMKSMMWVNCTAASRIRSERSERRGLKRNGTARRGPGH